MSKHRADAERLRQRIADMERSFAEKEKENVARIESVKSQAIFAVSSLRADREPKNRLNHG